MERYLTHKRKNIILSILFVLSVFLVFFHFTDTPKVWVDEGVFTETARGIAFHGVQGLQISPGVFFPMNALLSTGYPVILPVALSMRLFGVGIIQSRLPMVLYMLALVVLFYLFTKKKYGFYPAILSVLCLISFSPFYGNGRPVQGEVPGLVFIVLGALLLLYYEESDFQSKCFALFSGLCFGFATATKPIYLAILSVSLFFILIIWYQKIKNKKSIFFFLIGFLIPILVWVYTLAPTWRALLNIVPTYIHLAGSHGSTLSLVQTVLINAKRFFTESTPLLFTFLILVTIVSFFIRFQKRKGTSAFSIAEILLFLYIVINWLAYLPGTGWYRYFFPASVLLYLLFPAASLSLANVITSKKWRIIVLLIPLVLIAFQFTDLVFFSDTSFTATRSRNTELAAALGAIPRYKSILFYDTVESIVFFKGEKYSQYLLMPEVLQAGDSGAIAHPTEDVILTDELPTSTAILSCYTEQQVSSDYLLQRIPGCK